MRACVLFVLAMLVSAAGHADPAEDVFRFIAIDNVHATRRLIQEKRLDPKVVDIRGDTLLIASIRGDSDRTIDYLVADPSTDLEATNAAGETALMIAAYRKRRDVVEKLIGKDAEVNRPGWTALHYAASVDAGDIVALLLDHAAYIDAESPNRTTPLMMAARGGFDALCRRLIEAGADPTPVNERDVSASDFAKRAGNPTLAAWLTERAAAWRLKYGTAAVPKPKP